MWQVGLRSGVLGLRDFGILEVFGVLLFDDLMPLTAEAVSSSTKMGLDETNDGGEKSGVQQKGGESEADNDKVSASESSLCTTEEEEEDDDSHQIEVGPQCSLKEQIEKDKDDESLRKWKEQLLGNVDVNKVGVMQCKLTRQKVVYDIRSQEAKKAGSPFLIPSSVHLWLSFSNDFVLRFLLDEFCALENCFVVPFIAEKLEPEVKILSLSIVTADRPDIVLPIPEDGKPKGSWFTLKEGSRYSLKFSFQVSNNIVCGLKYTNTVWKTGMKVDSTKEMLGTFSPQQDPYTHVIPEETTPTGFFARGSYTAKTRFVDDDNKCHLEIDYTFDIKKDWATP
ncbi:unnamed protein product [Thlaspi arvense]|uniref:Rho GDP-dissociation inhibitor 1 n=1 Tax=Thlaspi arvense TaxID=13288 RepID=A0AAU9T832_THLAR|nr:unnamed protein product [Thlaspi arvense]